MGSYQPDQIVKVQRPCERMGEKGRRQSDVSACSRARRKRNTEVGIGTGLNCTTHRLIESVALLTKPIGIVTPLILSFVVSVAPRLISYRDESSRSYHTAESQNNSNRSYHTRKRHQIRLYKDTTPDHIVHGLQ